MQVHNLIYPLFCCLGYSSFAQLGYNTELVNDEKRFATSKSIVTEFPNEGWHERTDLNAARWATAPVFVPVCTSTTDDGDIYLIGGANNNFAYVNLNSVFNLASSSWSSKAPLPEPRAQVTPVQIDGKIYVCGGYIDAFEASNSTFIYDVSSDSWTEGAEMPEAVGDYGCGIYNGHIYVVGGSFTDAFYNTVQIYDPATDTWELGTDKPGTPVAGGRLGIAENKIVTAGGYDPIINGPVAEVFLGVIDPSDPTSIDWTILEDYPAGAMSRLAAGIAPQDTGRVYFAGGDPFSTGEFASALCFAYNLSSNEWEDGPDMIHGVNNIQGLAGFVNNGKQYLATMGGIEDFTALSWHEWLDLGAAEANNTTLLATVEDAEGTDCNGILQVDVSGGTAPYSFLWDDPSMQSTQTATGLCEGTYSVQVTDADGCTATANAALNIITGINDVDSKRRWSIYPNPTSGRLTIQNMSAGKSSRLIVTDLLGNGIMEVNPGPLTPDDLLEFDLTTLLVGVYIVKLFEADIHVASQKIIKY